MPFWRLVNFHRYVPQIIAIAKHINKYHDAYSTGAPKEDFQKKGEFLELRIGYPELKSIMLRWFLSKKDIFEQIESIKVALFYALSDLWSYEICYHCSRRYRELYATRLKGNYKDLDAKNRNALIRWVLSRIKPANYRNAERVVPPSKGVNDSATGSITDSYKLSRSCWEV